RSAAGHRLHDRLLPVQDREGLGGLHPRRRDLRRVMTTGRTPTLSSKGPNPLIGWQVDRAQIRTIGTDLQRPECILAERDGTLWAADARGGVMKIAPDGSQQLITQSVSGHFDLSGDQAQSLLTGTLPNGLAFARNGDILISNFGTDVLEIMSR